MRGTFLGNSSSGSMQTNFSGKYSSFGSMRTKTKISGSTSTNIVRKDSSLGGFMRTKMAGWKAEVWLHARSKFMPLFGRETRILEHNTQFFGVPGSLIGMHWMRVQRLAALRWPDLSESPEDPELNPLFCESHATRTLQIAGLRRFARIAWTLWKNKYMYIYIYLL